MPRYYFDVTDAKGHLRDDEGSDFASVEKARDECQGFLPDIAREQLLDGELHTITCDVRDEAGRVVYRGRLTFEGMWDPA